MVTWLFPAAAVAPVGAEGIPPPVLTVKLLVEVAVPPAVVTVIVPVVAPVGTVAIICVAVELVTVACVPLNLTVLLAAVVEKFVPVMVTAVPIAPLVGEKLVIVGAGCGLVDGVAFTSLDRFDSPLEFTAATA